MIKPGDRLPPVRLGVLTETGVGSISLESVASQGRAVLVGVPGAFTPPCTNRHIPDLLASMSALQTAGFTKFLCVAANDPFVLSAWRDRVDPLRKIVFLSDGNLELAEALGATVNLPGLYLGNRMGRFLLTSEHGVVRRVEVESDPEEVYITRPSRLVTRPMMI